MLALAVGVALIFAFEVADRGVLTAFGETLDTMAGRAALQVTAGGSTGQFPVEVAIEVGRVPGVKLAVPIVAGSVFLADHGERLSVQGMSIGNRATVAVYEPTDPEILERGGNPLALRAGAVLITRALSTRLGLEIGELIAVETPGGRRRLVVGGFLEPQGIASTAGESLAIMRLDTAQNLLTRPNYINRVDIVLSADSNRERVATAVTEMLPPGLHVEAPVQRKIETHRAILSLQRLLQALGLLVLLEALLVSFASLHTAFRSRSWQLGVLQAIGVRSRVLRRMLMSESIMLSIAGAAVGVPLGIVLAYILLPWITAATALNVMQTAPRTGPDVHAGAVALAAAFGMGGAALAALVPSRRAVDMSIADLVRLRRREPVERRASVSLTLLLIAGIVATIVAQVVTRDAGWGFAATALVTAATFLSARPLTEWALGLAERMFRARARPHAAVATLMLRQAPQRTALTVAIVAIGVGAVLWLRVVAWSFERSVIDAHSSALAADLVISSPHIASGINASPIDDALADSLRQAPGVAAVIGNRVVDWDYRGGTIAIDAYDETYFTTLAPEYARLIGAHDGRVWDRLAAGEAVVVSANFAYNFDVETADALTLETPTGPLTLPIAGVVNHLWSPRGTIVISRSLYRQQWEDPSVTRIFAQLEPGTDVASAKADIARRMGERYTLQLFSGRALVDYFADQVRRAFAGVDLLSALMLGVVLVAAAEAFGAGILENMWELGALRSLGMRRSALQEMVLLEAVLVGAIGLFLALLMGGTLAVFWLSATFTHLLGWVLEWHVPWVWAAIMGVSTMGACTLGAYIAGRQIARLAPATALRAE